MSTSKQEPEQDAVEPIGAPESDALPSEAPTGELPPPAQKNDAVAAQTPARPRATVAWVACVLALLAAIAAGAAWYEVRNSANAALSDTARLVRTAESELQKTRTAARQTEQAISELGSRLGAIDQQVGEARAQQQSIEALYQELARNRDEWRIAEADQMVSAAVQQLEISGNVRGALHALQLIELRLPRSTESRFDALRLALADDIERLKRHPSVDVVGIAQRIDRLILSIDGYPLRASAPAMSGAVLQESQPGALGAAQRLAAEVWRELRQLVVVRRMDQPDKPMLAPEQSYFLRENLRLRLLGARLALYARDSVSFANDLRTAGAWLEQHFDPDAAPVRDALSELGVLASIPVRIDPPSIAASVSAVQALKAAPARGS